MYSTDKWTYQEPPLKMTFQEKKNYPKIFAEYFEFCSLVSPRRGNQSLNFITIEIDSDLNSTVF